MRLISQNGEIDVPYEMTAIRSFEGNVLMNMVGDTGKGNVIARYSTPEKAQKAMEMLHEAYCGVFTTKINVGEVTLDELKFQLNEWKPQLMSVSDTSHVECKYFRFPTDEDLEE